jgi:hypothetical protein
LLNSIEKIIPKPNIFTKTQTQGSFWFFDLSSCKILAETNNNVLCAVFLLPLVSELQKVSSPGLEPRTDLGAVIFFPVTSSSKKISVAIRAVLLSSLVTQLQEQPSPGFEQKTFSEVLTPLKSVRFIII